MSDVRIHKSPYENPWWLLLPKMILLIGGLPAIGYLLHLIDVWLDLDQTNHPLAVGFALAALTLALLFAVLWFVSEGIDAMIEAVCRWFGWRDPWEHLRDAERARLLEIENKKNARSKYHIPFD